MLYKFIRECDIAVKVDQIRERRKEKIKKGRRKEKDHIHLHYQIKKNRKKSTEKMIDLKKRIGKRNLSRKKEKMSTIFIGHNEGYVAQILAVL